MNIIDKINTMKPSEAVRLMIEGLENPSTVVDMGTYGKVQNGVCYGCAATNAMAKLSEIDSANIKITHRRTEIWWADINGLSNDPDTLDIIIGFEMAIDELRRSEVQNFIESEIFKARGMVADEVISELESRSLTSLPELQNDNYQLYLSTYEELADALEEMGW